MKKIFRELVSKNQSAANVIVGMIGLLILLIPRLIAINNSLLTILTNVGSSFVATALVTWIMSFYVFELDRKKEMIHEWGLENIFPQKAVMNETANIHLNSCNRNLDIMGVGLQNFLSTQKETLVKLIASDVKIRIITCQPGTLMLQQRAQDEMVIGDATSSECLSEQVQELSKWIKEMAIKYPNNKVGLRYHATYPAFSYLRIDDVFFWGPNLFYKPSQQCIAWEFCKNGKGFRYFLENFDELWKDERFCSTNMKQPVQPSHGEFDHPSQQR